MNKAVYILSFVCGTIVGVVLATRYMKEDDHEETKEVKIVEMDDDSEKEDEIVIPKSQDDGETTKIVSLFNDIIHENGYAVGDHTNGIDDGPYVIAADDFGDFEDYDAISMTLTSDGVLLDNDLSKVEDPVNNVGVNYMKYFGVYPDDPYTVYIRNDELCCDFEIVKDLRTYAEIHQDMPHMKWRDNE